MNAEVPNPFWMTSLTLSLFDSSSTEFTIGTGLETVIKEVKTEL